jgi:hypothetical protein
LHCGRVLRLGLQKKGGVQSVAAAAAAAQGTAKGAASWRKVLQGEHGGGHLRFNRLL